MPTITFRTVFCERFGCKPEEYESVAFSKFLFGHARFIAPIILLVFPNFFDEDMKFVKYIGDAIGTREAAAEVQEFKDANDKRGGYIRMTFNIRVSARKARRMFRELHTERSTSAAGTLLSATSMS